MSIVRDIFRPNGFVDLTRFAPAASVALDEAVVAARTTRWQSIRAPHLFLGLLLEPDRTINLWALRAGVDLLATGWKFRHMLRQPGALPSAPRMHREFLSQGAIAALRAAATRCEEHARLRVTPADLLWAVLAQDGCVIAGLSSATLPAPVLRFLLAEADRPPTGRRGTSHSR